MTMTTCDRKPAGSKGVACSTSTSLSDAESENESLSSPINRRVLKTEQRRSSFDRRGGVEASDSSDGESIGPAVPIRVAAARQRVILSDSDISDDDGAVDRLENNFAQLQVEESGTAARAKGVKAAASDPLEAVSKRLATIELSDSASDGSSDQSDASGSEDEDESFHSLFSQLYPHQKEGVAWMWGLHTGGMGGVLGDDMGLGWENELGRWLVKACPRAEVVVLSADVPAKRRQGILRTAMRGGALRRGAVCVTSYGLATSRPDLFEDPDGRRKWDYVILDEGHKGWELLLQEVNSYVHKLAMLPLLTRQDSQVQQRGAVKNPTTQLSRAMHGLPTLHRLLVTGTPIQNNLKELWALMDWCCNGHLLKSYKSFAMTYSEPIERGQDRDATPLQVARSQARARELWLMLRPHLLQRSKEDLKRQGAAAAAAAASKAAAQGTDATNAPEPASGPAMRQLPTKTEVVVWVALSAAQRCAYSDFLASGRVANVLSGDTNPLASITYLKKVCGHTLLLNTAGGTAGGGQWARAADEDEQGAQDASDTEETDGWLSPLALPPRKVVWSLDPSVTPEELKKGSAKLHVAMELLLRLKDEGHRTLVFSQSVRVLDMLQRCLESAAMRFVRIDGSSSDMDRARCISSFNADASLAVCLLSTKVGGYGITLTGANRVVVYDPSWNPAEDRQAVDRAFRIGQTRDVVVYRMITAGTVEEKMYEKQIFKDGLRHTVLDNKGGSARGWGAGLFSRAELKDLFTLGPHGETRLLAQLEERHGPLPKSAHKRQIDCSFSLLHLLAASEHAFQRNLAQRGGHTAYLTSLKPLGVLGVSLHGSWANGAAHDPPAPQSALSRAASSLSSGSGASVANPYVKRAEPEAPVPFIKIRKKSESRAAQQDGGAGGRAPQVIAVDNGDDSDIVTALNGLNLGNAPEGSAAGATGAKSAGHSSVRNGNDGSSGGSRDGFTADQWQRERNAAAKAPPYGQHSSGGSARGPMHQWLNQPRRGAAMVAAAGAMPPQLGRYGSAAACAVDLCDDNDDEEVDVDAHFKRSTAAAAAAGGAHRSAQAKVVGTLAISGKGKLSTKARASAAPQWSASADMALGKPARARPAHGTAAAAIADGGDERKHTNGDAKGKPARSQIAPAADGSAEATGLAGVAAALSYDQSPGERSPSAAVSSTHNVDAMAAINHSSCIGRTDDELSGIRMPIAATGGNSAPAATGSVCAVCREKAQRTAPGITCCRCCCGLSAAAAARYDSLLIEAEVAEHSVTREGGKTGPERALSLYLECLALCDTEPRLQYKVAQLGAELGLL
ncbi:P-loop containing nucleoside triphosphate hydrolase protein [Tribonema minus]|uniref:P-loop containing nucleoside triphosphate hydrolase protein n=1 Tax=Tribonema minus TaxID=303371 RepID=A0A836CB04_9STRA|nr:P-loop containing nucleoside triphosphate hydrolase protein [Tribonema minus]